MTISAASTDAPPAALTLGRRAYVGYAVLLLTLGNALAYTDRQLFSILAPAIKAEFGLSDATIGALSGPVFMLPFVLLGLPLARLADRWSRRGVLALCAAFWSAMTAFCGLAANGFLLAIGRAGVGTGEAGGSPPSQALIADMVPAARRAFALSVFTCGTFAGTAAANWGGAVLATELGWRTTFLIVAAPGPILAALVWLTLPANGTAPALARAEGPGLLAVLRQAWVVPSVRLLCLAGGAVAVYSTAMLAWVPSYFLRSHGLTLVETGFWLGAVGTAGGLVGTLAGGALADRLGRRDKRWLLLLPAMGLALSVPVYVGQMLVPPGATLTVGGIALPIVALPGPLGTFLMGFWLPAGYAAMTTLARPEMRAQMTALFISLLTVIGAGIGPLFTGVISDLLTPRLGAEALRYSLLLATLSLGVAALLFWRASTHYAVDAARLQAAR